MNRVIPGRSIAEVIGTKTRPWLREESQERFDGMFSKVLATKQVAECEVMGLSGQSWLVRLAPLVHEDRVAQVLACTLEVTEQRHLQQQLAHRRKIESLGTMARGIAHDFNNLLTAVLGSAGLARRRLAAGREVEPLLDEIEAAGERAAELCEQMLVYAGRDLPSSEPGDLNRVIEQLTRLTRAAVGSNIRMERRLAEALPRTRCNAAQLSQVVLNLVNNAADAIGEAQGRIVISTAEVQLEDPETDFVTPLRRPVATCGCASPTTAPASTRRHGSASSIPSTPRRWRVTASGSRSCSASRAPRARPSASTRARARARR